MREDNVIAHVSTKKHVQGRSKLEDQNSFQTDICALLKQSALSHLVCVDDHFFRVDMVRSYLIAGIKVSKLRYLRGFIERYSGGRKSTDTAHLLRDYLPIIAEQEYDTLRKEVADRFVTIFFDETTIFWVCFCVIVLFVDDGGRMQFRVAALSLYKEAAEEKITNTLSSQIISAISTKLRIPKERVKVIVRDGVAINSLAVTKLVGGVVRDPTGRALINYPARYEAVDIKCFSHTTDLCGAEYTHERTKFSRIRGPEAKAFYNHLNGIFSSSSAKPNNRWRQLMSTSMPSVSATRWWSTEEWYEYVLKHMYPDIETNRVHTLASFLEERINADEAIGNNFQWLVRSICDNSDGFDARRKAQIVTEIAIVVDITKCLRETTYLLEGDGPLAFFVIEIVNRASRTLANNFPTMDYPNIRKAIDDNVTTNLFPPQEYLDFIGDPPTARPLLTEEIGVDTQNCRDTWIAFCHRTSYQCRNYFMEEVVNHDCMPLFEATRLGNPEFMKNVDLTAQQVRDMVAPLCPKIIPVRLVDQMIRELADYQAAVGHYRIDGSIQERIERVADFWAIKRKNLKGWTAFAHMCMLLQPSSACVERAFSLLKYILSRSNTLHDLIEITLMLQYNRRGIGNEEVSIDSDDENNFDSEED